MFDKIETLVMELRKLEHIHICQEMSLQTIYINTDGVYKFDKQEAKLESVVQKIHIIMYEFVDRRKFDEYKLVLDAEYSSDDHKEVLEVIYKRLSELKEIYTRNEE